MPVPRQRNEHVWARHDQQEKNIKREHAKDCDFLRQSHMAKMDNAEAQKLAQQAAARRKWNIEQRQRKRDEKRQQQEEVTTTRRHVRELEDVRLQCKAEELEAQFVQQMLRLRPRNTQYANDARRQRTQELSKRLTNHEKEVERRRLVAAGAGAEEAAEHAERNAVFMARRNEIQKREEQVLRAQQHTNQMMKATMAYQTQQRNEAQRDRTKAHRTRGEIERDANISYLNIDTRVARWKPNCWHDNDEKTDWRWPFSLDWSWLVRGEHTLRVREERFMGLKLPPGFVPPSERLRGPSTVSI